MLMEMWGINLSSSLLSSSTGDEVSTDVSKRWQELCEVDFVGSDPAGIVGDIKTDIMSSD